MKKTRHVLLSNDDGVFFPGIRALADAFLGAGWRVTVSAPDRERSAASHSMMLVDPIVVSRETWDGDPDMLSVWKTSGWPSDCVRLALMELMDERPDIIVSGINNGWNAGTDCHYSGTVAAAKEGLFHGIPALAVSNQHQNPARNACAAQYALHACERILAMDDPCCALWNINIPDCEPEEIRGFVEATMRRSPYTDGYDKIVRPNGRAVFWLHGSLIPDEFEEGSDLWYLYRGYATITGFSTDWGILGACKTILHNWNL